MSIADIYEALLGNETLIQELGGLINERNRYRDQLAKMPRTPDGVLVVLGETTAWRRSCRGEVVFGKVCTIAVGLRGVLCGATWIATTGEQRGYALTDFATCYGSEAKLLEAEVKR